MLVLLNLMLRLFQENKSYGVKPICSHPLMSRYCTSLCHVWHTNYYSIAGCLKALFTFRESNLEEPFFFCNDGLRNL